MRKLRHSRLNNLLNTIQAVGGGAETETSISSKLEGHAPNCYMVQNILGRDQMSMWMLVGNLGSVENIWHQILQLQKWEKQFMALTQIHCLTWLESQFSTQQMYVD